MAWFLCLTCAVRGPGAEIISGALPGPLSSTPWLETEHQNLPWKPGSRVQELGGWHRRGGAGDVKHPSLGLASCHGGVAHPPHPPPPPHCWLCMVRMGSILSGRASLSHTRLPTGLEHFNVGRRRPDLDTGLASPGADVQPLCWVKAESWHPPVQLFPRSLDETIRKTRAWRIPGTGKPGGLLSMGRTESDTTEAT